MHLCSPLSCVHVTTAVMRFPAKLFIPFSFLVVNAGYFQADEKWNGRHDTYTRLSFYSLYSIHYSYLSIYLSPNVLFPSK